MQIYTLANMYRCMDIMYWCRKLARCACGVDADAGCGAVRDSRQSNPPHCRPQRANSTSSLVVVPGTRRFNFLPYGPGHTSNFPSFYFSH